MRVDVIEGGVVGLQGEVYLYDNITVLFLFGAWITSSSSKQRRVVHKVHTKHRLPIQRRVHEVHTALVVHEVDVGIEEVAHARSVVFLECTDALRQIDDKLLQHLLARETLVEVRASVIFFSISVSV